MYEGLSTNRQSEYTYEITKGVAVNIPDFLMDQNKNLYLLLNALSREIYKLLALINEIKNRRSALTEDDFNRLTGEEIYRLINDFSQIILNTSLDTEKKVLYRHVNYNLMYDGSKEQIDGLITNLIEGASINYIEQIDVDVKYEFIEGGIGTVVSFTSLTDPNDTYEKRYFISLHQLSKEQLKIVITTDVQINDNDLIAIYKLLSFFIPKGIIFTVEVSNA